MESTMATKTEVESLRSVLQAIEALTTRVLPCLQGENSKVDMLMQNINSILEKNCCSLDIIKPKIKIENTGESASTSQSQHQETESRQGSSSVFELDTEFKKLRVVLHNIQLQLAAFRIFTEDSCHLKLLLEIFDVLFAKHHLDPLTLQQSAFSRVAVDVEVINGAANESNSKKRSFNTSSEPVATTLKKCRPAPANQNAIETQRESDRSNNLASTSDSNSDSKILVDSFYHVIKTEVDDSDQNVSYSEESVQECEVKPNLFQKSDEHPENNNNNLASAAVQTEADLSLDGIQNEQPRTGTMNGTSQTLPQLIQDQQEQLVMQPQPEQIGNVRMNEGITFMNFSNDPQDKENKGKEKILTEILSKLDLKDLKKCRFVSKKWKEVTDSLFIKKQWWKFVVDARIRRDKGKVWSDLSDTMEISSSLPGFTKLPFPLATLVLKFAGHSYDYSNRDLQNFCLQHGAHITRLELQYFSGPVETLEDLLLHPNKLSKVRDVVVGAVWFPANQKEFLSPNKGGSPIVLPNLETIQFELDQDPRNKEDQAHFKAFLKAAVNLKEIKNVQPHLLKSIIEAGTTGIDKLSCIKNFEFVSQLEFPRRVNGANKKILQSIDDESFTKFGEFQPKLRFLNINVQCADGPRNPNPSQISTLSTILKSSKESLVSLRIPSLFFLPGLKIPTLKNLKELEIYHLRSKGKGSGFGALKSTVPSDLKAIFPAKNSLNLNKVFPIVQRVTLNLFGDSADPHWISKYFPKLSSGGAGGENSRSFRSVTRLDFRNDYSFGQNKDLQLIFPQLTHVRIDKFDLIFRNGNGSGFAAGILPIKSLELHGVRFTGVKSRLDSIFTGYPIKKCEELNEALKNGTPIVSHTATGVNRSFQKMTDLEVLKIVFDHKENLDLEFPTESNAVVDGEGAGDGDHSTIDWAVITPVSCVYGFSSMISLKKVIIAYDHTLPIASVASRIFKPLTAFRYVTVIHEPNQY